MGGSKQAAAERDSKIDRLADAVESLVGEVRDVRDHLHNDLAGLSDAIDELRSQLQWACNNFLPEFRLQSMAKDPCDPEWGRKLNHCRLACTECDCDPPASLEAALEAGWSQLMQDDGEAWTYLGLCPDCLKREDDEVEATRRPAEAGEASAPPRLEHAMDDAERPVYCCETPKLEWNGDPAAPGIACETCGHVVADSGALVFFEDREDVEPSGNPQKMLF